MRSSHARRAAAAAAEVAATTTRPSALPIPSLAPRLPRRSALNTTRSRNNRPTTARHGDYEVTLDGPHLTLREQEHLLRAEVADLERRLESTVQAESSAKATQHLPPLDELTLEQLYHALTLPEPLTPAEERLLLLDQRRSVKRVLGIDPSSAPAAALDAPAPERERVHLRLRALESRVAGIALATDADLVQRLTQERDDLASRVGALIDSTSSAAAAPSEHGAEHSLDAADEDAFGQVPDEVPGQHVFHELISLHANEGDVIQCQDAIRQMQHAGFEPTSLTYHWLVKAHVRAGNTLLAMQTLTALEATPTPPHLSTYTTLIDHLLHHPSASRAVQSTAWSIFYHMRLAVHPVPDTPLYALMLHACARGVPQPSDVMPIARNALPVVRAVRRLRKPGRPDAERALDLFREMTRAYALTPNAEVYNNLILACCRSGEKRYYHEAFRLLREMLQRSEQSARAEGLTLSGVLSEAYTAEDGPAAGQPAKQLRFTPDRYTFHAFLQGCARHGDLARARWVLAEMVRSAIYYQRALTRLSSADADDGGGGGTDEARKQLQELDECRPSAETLVHVFYAYASYQVPVPRAAINVVGSRGAGGEGDADKTAAGVAPGQGVGASLVGTSADPSPAGSAPQSLAPAGAPPADSPTEVTAAADDAASAFTLDLPQTSAELLREVRGLMARIVSDYESSRSGGSGQGSVLSTVVPTAQLVNAYLSAVQAHSAPAHRMAILEAAMAPIQSKEQGLLPESEPDGAEAGADGDERLQYGTRWPEQALFARLGLEPNSRTLQLGLDLCADVSTRRTGRPGDDEDGDARLGGPGWREVRKWGDGLWAQWRVLDEVEGRAEGEKRGKGWAIAEARRREKAWAARIRHLAKFDHLDDALQTLREFTQLYPPHRQGRPLPASSAQPGRSPGVPTPDGATELPTTTQAADPSQNLRVSRTHRAAQAASDALALPLSLLSGIGPLSVPPEAYRVLAATSSRSPSVEEDRDVVAAAVTDAIRPGLTFHELELLHHRLVETGGRAAARGIALVTGVGRAYEAQKKESW